MYLANKFSLSPFSRNGGFGGYFVLAHRQALSNVVIRLSVCLSVCPMPLAQSGTFYHSAYYRTLIANNAGSQTHWLALP